MCHRRRQLRAGDVNDESGFSPFPGNINQIIIKLEPYVRQLEETGGVIAEFVNPKYRDATRTAFKKPTRLECMMQDYPKSLPRTEAVGFTTYAQVRAPQLSRLQIWATERQAHGRTVGLVQRASALGLDHGRT